MTGTRRGRRTTLPPLALSALMLLLLLAVLPSALNAPQSHPNETLEYAPVPPDDDAPDTPRSGNLSSLGLAAGFSLADGTDGLGDLGPTGPQSVGKNPSTKRCVGRPPRQTED